MKELHEAGEFINGEVNCIGAGSGGGFTNTKELVHIMKYKQTMESKDVKHRERAVDEEQGACPDCQALSMASHTDLGHTRSN
jgi:hypothetical protein